MFINWSCEWCYLLECSLVTEVMLLTTATKSGACFTVSLKWLNSYQEVHTLWWTWWYDSTNIFCMGNLNTNHRTHELCCKHWSATKLAFTLTVAILSFKFLTNDLDRELSIIIIIRDVIKIDKTLILLEMLEYLLDNVNDVS